jgi:RNA polymerase sigma-70 factor (ECF subfamily)
MTREECKEVWIHFGDYIHKVCIHLLKNIVAADDIRQEIFMRLLKSDEKLSEMTNIRTWLYAVARNCCMDYYRARAFEEERLALSWAQEVTHLQESTETAWEILQQAERSNAVLPPLTCILIKLNLVDGYTLDELAALTDLSREVVSKRIRRGLKMLR